MNLNNRTVWIGVAVAAGLIFLFFIGRLLLPKTQPPSPARTREQTKKVIEQVQLTRHQLCRYADSVGIDTSRYAPKTTDSAFVLTTEFRRLLIETRYGEKPARLAYTGLRETMDSTWTYPADLDFTPAKLRSIPSFRPYNQLIGHYSRLRNGIQKTPAVADSLRLIRQTLNFYRYVNRFGTEKFVVVNIPAAELTVFDQQGNRLLTMPVIAGRADKRTPLMTTVMNRIVTYPYWNVPRKIALAEMLPRMQRDLSYIYNQNLQILDNRDREVDPEEIDWDGLSTTNFPYRVRQASGCQNALGLIKFELKNPLAIYLHDTNSRDLFKRTTDRWRSHGCIRLQKPVELANLVLGRTAFNAEFMNRCLVDQTPKPLSIPKPVPVFITYNRADVDSTGKLRFYADIYRFDKH